MNSKREVAICVAVICFLVVQAIMYGAVAFVLYDVTWWLLMGDITLWGRFFIGLCWLFVGSILSAFFIVFTSMFLDQTRE